MIHHLQIHMIIFFLHLHNWYVDCKIEHTKFHVVFFLFANAKPIFQPETTEKLLFQPIELHYFRFYLIV